MSATGNVEGPEPCSLFVTGMNQIDSERWSHTTWSEGMNLSVGDSLAIEFADVEFASPPVKEVAADSEQHQAEQRWFEGQMETVTGPPPPRKRVLTGLRFSLSANGEPPTDAVLEGEDEFISFSVVWNKYHPERCRVSLRSFSGEDAFARRDARAWFRSELHIGEMVTIKVTT